MYRALPDRQNSRTGIPALPFCDITLKAPKPLSSQYPQTLTTLGDHLRKKRLDLKLIQRDVAKMLEVETDTVTYWETNRVEPSPAFIPKIIDFLGYVPLSILPDDPRKRFVVYRKLAGLSQEEFARKLRVDPGTLRKWEKGKLLSSEIEQSISSSFLETIQRLLNAP